MAEVARLPKGAPAEVRRFPLRQSLLLHFRADDPRLITDKAGRVTLWPNRSGFTGDAAPATSQAAPIKTTAKIGEYAKPVIRFDGQSVLESQRPAPLVGTLFVVFQTAATARSGERLLGWEDADTGKHGLGLMTDPGGRLHAILRKDGQSGDVVDTRKPTGFETVCITWGPGGTTMRRNGVEIKSPMKIDGISSDPKITALMSGTTASTSGL